MVWQSETIHLGEPVQTHIIQSFIYEVVLSSQEKVWSDLEYGPEVNQFLSYNRPRKTKI